MAELPYWVSNMRRIMKVDAERTGQTHEVERVIGRSPTGTGGAALSVQRRGDSMGGVSAADGRDYRAGESVVMARIGRAGQIPIVAGKAPPYLRATESTQVWDVDITSVPLLGGA